MARPAFAQQRSFQRARVLAASSLACLGRRTLSGVLCAGGQQFRDWSSTYRLFEQERMDLEGLWRVPLQATLRALPSSAPVVALLDDTLVPKRGRHVAGTAWRRDPLGPKFSPNFVWANRFLQISLALPADPASPISSARAIPIDLQHAPTPAKLQANDKKDPEQCKAWKKAAATAAVSALGARRIHALRQAVDQQPGGTQRPLLVCADATFTNRTVLKDLAERTALVGFAKTLDSMPCLLRNHQTKAALVAAGCTATGCPLRNNFVRTTPMLGNRCRPSLPERPTPLT